MGRDLDLDAAMSEAAGASKRLPEQTVPENIHGKPMKRALSATRDEQKAHMTSLEIHCGGKRT